MSDSDRWLSDYGDNHREIDAPAIYWCAVAGLVLATVGMLWSLPVPEAFTRISPVLNWGTTFLMAAIVYYFIISISLAIGMLPIVFAISSLAIWLDHSPYDAGPVSAALFVLSILGLSAGRRTSGGIKAVFGDIQMMMIAPVWILSRLYKRFGIPF